MTTHEQNGLLWFSSSLLEGVCHGFSTRKGGVSTPPWDTLNLASWCGDTVHSVEENYRRFCGALKIDAKRIICSNQVHGTTVRVCTETDAGKGLWLERDYHADALVTNVRGLALAVFSADCGTILLYDPVRQTVGAVHAGWRGCAGGIVGKTVQIMQSVFGTQPDHVLAALGPCIQTCCFETDGDVPDAMTAAFGAAAEPYLKRRGEKWHVDLAGLNRQGLLSAGIAPERIDSSELCTACRTDLFWSHRRQGWQRGLQAAMIALPLQEDMERL